MNNHDAESLMSIILMSLGLAILICLVWKAIPEVHLQLNVDIKSQFK